MYSKLCLAQIGLIITCSALLTHAAELTDGQFINLWPDKAPFAQGDQPADIPGFRAFLPRNPTGAAVVVCPGGGYGGLAGHEAAPVGKWLADHGVTAFVLRYRLGAKYHHPVELGDAQRAIRMVRANAKAWKLNPDRIGILGFSAGGHLASSAATHYTAGDPQASDPVERVSCRPNLQILIYPVITMGPGGHAGSRHNLLGASPSQELIDLLSNEKQVTKDTPPAFLVHSTVDTVVPVSNSDNYATALKAAGVPYEYVRSEMGEHGFGLIDRWTLQCVKWLERLEFAVK